MPYMTFYESPVEHDNNLADHEKRKFNNKSKREYDY